MFLLSSEVRWQNFVLVTLLENSTQLFVPSSLQAATVKTSAGSLFCYMSQTSTGRLYVKIILYNNIIDIGSEFLDLLENEETGGPVSLKHSVHIIDKILWSVSVSC